MLMLCLVLLALGPATTLAAPDKVYRIHRQDLDWTPSYYSNPTSTRSSGIYRVSRQDFDGTNNVPFLPGQQSSPDRWVASSYAARSNGTFERDYIARRLFMPAPNEQFASNTYPTFNWPQYRPSSPTPKPFSWWLPTLSTPSDDDNLDDGILPAISDPQVDENGVLPALNSDPMSGPRNYDNTPEPNSNQFWYLSGDNRARPSSGRRYHSINDDVEASDELLSSFYSPPSALRSPRMVTAIDQQPPTWGVNSGWFQSGLSYYQYRPYPSLPYPHYTSPSRADSQEGVVPWVYTRRHAFIVMPPTVPEMISENEETENPFYYIPRDVVETSVNNMPDYDIPPIRYIPDEVENPLNFDPGLFMWSPAIEQPTTTASEETSVTSDPEAEVLGTSSTESVYREPRETTMAAENEEPSGTVETTTTTTTTTTATTDVNEKANPVAEGEPAVEYEDPDYADPQPQKTESAMTTSESSSVNTPESPVTDEVPSISETTAASSDQNSEGEYHPYIFFMPDCDDSSSPPTSETILADHTDVKENSTGPMTTLAAHIDVEEDSTTPMSTTTSTEFVGEEDNTTPMETTTLDYHIDIEEEEASTTPTYTTAEESSTSPPASMTTLADHSVEEVSTTEVNTEVPEFVTKYINLDSEIAILIASQELQNAEKAEDSSMQQTDSDFRNIPKVVIVNLDEDD